MFFNPFAMMSASAIPQKRHSRLRELDLRMQDFLTTKRGAASGKVLENVKSARDHVRREIQGNNLSRAPK
ncbi:hypothetical protein [Hoeflea sp.]|uniref:hypothetical protein n=1 Tax=Hoeflea sp. TaxID=1940281 RepID=UPI0037498C42